MGLERNLWRARKTFSLHEGTGRDVPEVNHNVGPMQSDRAVSKPEVCLCLGGGGEEEGEEPGLWGGRHA